MSPKLYLTAQNRNLSLINRLWLIKMMLYLLISSLTTGLWRATPSGHCFVFTSCFFFHLSFRSSHFIAPISFNIFWFSKIFSVTSGSLPVWCYLTCVHHLLWNHISPYFPCKTRKSNFLWVTYGSFFTDMGTVRDYHAFEYRVRLK